MVDHYSHYTMDINYTKNVIPRTGVLRNTVVVVFVSLAQHPLQHLNKAPLIPIVLRKSLRHNLSRRIQQCNQYESMQHEINYESAMERLEQKTIIKQCSKDRQ